MWPNAGGLGTVSDMPRPDRRLWFGLVLLALLLLTQEVALRLIFPVPEALHFNRLLYSDLHVTPELASRPRVAHREFIWASDPDGVESRHRLNLYGFRDRTWSLAPDPERMRLMMVGDSFVEGFTAAEDETLPRQFERISRAAGRELEVMNLGVAAAGIPQYLRLIRDAAPLFHPRQILLVIYANDLPAPDFDPSLPWGLRDGPEPEYSRTFKPRLIHVLDRLLRGEPVPRSFVENPVSFLAPVPDPSNPWSHREFAERFSPVVSAPIIEAMAAGRFNPHVVNEDWFYRRHLQQPADPEPFLAGLRDFLDADQIGLFVIYLPSRGQISDEYGRFQSEYSVSRTVASIQGPEFQIHAAALHHSCERLDLPFLDLTPALREREAVGERLFWNYDEHLKPDGYALVARLIHEWWSARD